MESTVNLEIGFINPETVFNKEICRKKKKTLLIDKLNNDSLNIFLINETFFQNYFYLSILHKHPFDLFLNNSEKKFGQNLNKQEKIIEVFIEKFFCQIVTLIYLVGERFLQKIYFSFFKKENSILSFSFKKRTEVFKTFWSKISDFHQNSKKWNIRVFTNFQTSNKKTEFLYHTFDNINQLENIRTLFEIIRGRRGKTWLIPTYKTLRIKKNKALNIMNLRLNCILKDELKKKMDFNKIIKIILGSNLKKDVNISRKRKLSPSILRVFKSFFQYYFITLRDPLKTIKEQSFFFSIFFIKYGNPFLYDFYFHIFKYFQCFEDKVGLKKKNEIIRKNFKFKTNFSTRYFFSKSTYTDLFAPWVKFFNYAKLFIRINLSFKLFNWSKNTSLFLKDLNGVKFNLNVHISKLSFDFKKSKKFNVIKLDLLYIEKKYNPFIFNRFMIVEKYKRNFQKKFEQNKNISLISLITENQQIFLFFGFLISLLFNNKYCENFLSNFLNENFTLDLNLWAFNYRNFQKICRILLNMQNIEKKNFLKILKFYFFKKVTIFNFFIKKISNIDSKNYIPFIKKKTFLFELFLITLGFQENVILKSHHYNFLHMMVFEISLSFFYKRTKKWIVNFYISTKLVQKIKNFFLFPSGKTFAYIEQNIINLIQEKIFFLKLILKNKRKNLFLFILYITAMCHQNNKYLKATICDELFKYYNCHTILDGAACSIISSFNEKTHFFQIIDQVLIDFDLFYKKKLFFNKLPEIFLFVDFQPELHQNLTFLLQFFFSFIKGGDLLIKLKISGHSLLSTLNYCKVGFKTEIKYCPNYGNSVLLRDFLYIKNSSLCKIFRNEIFIRCYNFVIYEPKTFLYSYELDKYLKNQLNFLEEKVLFLNKKFIKKLKVQLSGKQ